MIKLNLFLGIILISLFCYFFINFNEKKMPKKSHNKKIDKKIKKLEINNSSHLNKTKILEDKTKILENKTNILKEQFPEKVKKKNVFAKKENKEKMNIREHAMYLVSLYTPEDKDTVKIISLKEKLVNTLVTLRMQRISVIELFEQITILTEIKISFDEEIREYLKSQSMAIDYNGRKVSKILFGIMLTHRFVYEFEDGSIVLKKQ